jgi:large subunit ribosomal protein L4
MATVQLSPLVTPVTGTFQVPIFNRAGEAVGTVEVDAAEFGGKINKQLLHEVVLMHLANQRLGTHSTLRRGEVAGSTKKLFKQKHTGNARAGSKRTNKRRGGGTAKGPKPRDYSYRLPKKAVRAATRMALLGKFRDQEVLVLDDELNLEAPKTRLIAELLRALKLHETSTLIGIPDYNYALYLSVRNIPNVELYPVTQFNTYEVLHKRRLLLTRNALEILRKRTASTQPSNSESESA